MNGVRRQLAADFSLQRLPATLAAGAVLAVIDAVLGVAIMSLIFAGDLASALPVGIGIGLSASGVTGLIIALRSGFPGMYAGSQDVSAAILGLAATTVAATVVQPDSVDTVVALMAVTSLAVGTTFWLLGVFRLGEVARFVPFPVVGGLLAGTGYLILAGAYDLLDLGGVLDGTAGVAQWGLAWPGVAFGGACLFVSRRGLPSAAYLVILATGTAGFHLVRMLASVGRAESFDRGWMLGPLPDGLWPGLAIRRAAGADWGAVAAEAPNLLIVLLLVPLTLLLYLSALEVASNRDLDVNAELRATGLANLGAGAMGGPPGFIYMATTLVSHRVIGPRRGPAVVAAAGLLAIVAAGGAVLELLPQFVVGGLLVFVGADFLIEWLWVSRRRMNRLDHALTVGIVVVVAAAGFLPGVAAGAAAAVALFVVRYSRTDVVKHQLTGSDQRSNIERSAHHVEQLSRRGDAVLILELQGFVFFGTANHILDRVRDHRGRTPSLRFVVIDFRLVAGVDSTAVMVFERVAAIAEEHGLDLVLTGATGHTRAQFAELVEAHSDRVFDEPDLDRGMARCEDLLLEDETAPLSTEVFPETLLVSLGPHLRNRTVAPGERLMQRGDPTPGIFLITEGQATVLMDTASGEGVRLRTIQEGTVLGEISLYRGQPCGATVVADTSCTVLHLTPDAFSQLHDCDPVAAAELHHFVAWILAARVDHANRTVQALRR